MNAQPKPPYSKDGKLQLCTRCNRYCRRTLNVCPTCYPPPGRIPNLPAALRAAHAVADAATRKAEDPGR